MYIGAGRLRSPQFTIPTFRRDCAFLRNPVAERRRDAVEMRLFQRLFLLIFLGFVFLILAAPIRAEGEFETSFDITYEVRTAGVTAVTQKISLTNKVSDIYAKEYHFSIGSTRVQNANASDGLGPIDTKIETTNNTTEIHLFFNEKIVGKEETLAFTLYFESLDFATRSGQVWEVAIPKMSKTIDIKDYNLRLIVPTSFQEPAYMLPTPARQETSNNKTIYFFSKETALEKGITAAFGQHQIFDFTINYHLKNPLKEKVKTEIALPPETPFQKIFYEEIEPSPYEVSLDPDGNWLATYILEPESNIDIRTRGAVELFLKPRKGFPELKIDPSVYLKAQKYWEVEDPEIKKLASELKTPQAIYNFVVENLIYDYGKVKKPIGRLGAAQALQNKSSAICTEFTDLFIALSRAAGIPAREANGYAYTTNPALRPLSLEEDILHAWPEYYDQNLNFWKPVDPTWAKTTGGVDFFSKLDLNHFVFTFHGLDSAYPYPAGSYKIDEQQVKDIHITFGTLPKKKLALKLKSQLPKNLFGGLALKSSLFLENKSNYTLLNQSGQVSATSGMLLSDPNFSVKIFPPYSRLEIPIRIKPTSFFRSSEEKITINFAGQVLEETIKTQPIFLIPLQYFSYPLFIGLLLGLFIVKLSQWIVKKFLH